MTNESGDATHAATESGGASPVEEKAPTSWNEVEEVIGDLPRTPEAAEAPSESEEAPPLKKEAVPEAEPAAEPAEPTTDIPAPTAEATPVPAPAVPAQADVATTTDVPAAPSDIATLAVGQVKLVIEQGLSLNKEFLVSDDEMLIGRRDPEQDFIPDIDLFDQETPNNRYISRRQAKLYFQDGGLWVEDLDSSNGTALNNHSILPHQPRRLKPGDKVLLGQSVLLRVRKL